LLAGIGKHIIHGNFLFTDKERFFIHADIGLALETDSAVVVANTAVVSSGE
jgi:hypothetical protein